MKYFPKTKAVIMTAAHRMPGVFYFHVDSVETVTTRAYNVIKQGLVRTPPTKMVFQSPQTGALGHHMEDDIHLGTKRSPQDLNISCWESPVFVTTLWTCSWQHKQTFYLILSLEITVLKHSYHLPKSILKVIIEKRKIILPFWFLSVSRKAVW